LFRFFHFSKNIEQPSPVFIGIGPNSKAIFERLAKLFLVGRVNNRKWGFTI